MANGVTFREGLDLDDFLEMLEKSTTQTRRDAKKELYEGARQIMRASQQMAPVDLHNLEMAHKIETVRLNENYMTLSITVGGVVGGVDVDIYATRMHESTYGLGKGSILKNSANPPDRRVGPKFLERAVGMFELPIINRLRSTLPGAK